MKFLLKKQVYDHYAKVGQFDTAEAMVNAAVHAAKLSPTTLHFSVDIIPDQDPAAVTEALEKQVPTAPTPYGKWPGKCPRCGVVFVDRSTQYCGNCGQALDWTKGASK